MSKGNARLLTTAVAIVLASWTAVALVHLDDRELTSSRLIASFLACRPQALTAFIGWAALSIIRWSVPEVPTWYFVVLVVALGGLGHICWPL